MGIPDFSFTVSIIGLDHFATLGLDVPLISKISSRRGCTPVGPGVACAKPTRIDHFADILERQMRADFRLSAEVVTAVLEEAGEAVETGGGGLRAR
ncbi:MAG TPA: hypothetical protein VGD06_02605 [Acidobacteriota bacterium]